MLSSKERKRRGKVKGVQINKNRGLDRDRLFRKGQSTLFFLRTLRSFSVYKRLLQIVYRSVVASSLLFLEPFWDGGGNKTYRALWPD